MAERRMFAKTIIDSDAFIDMPLSTQALYFHLSMRADDDGFINNPKKIQRMIGATDDDLKLLIAKRFIIPFESGIVVIKHWKIHNYIRNDRYKPTVYEEEKKLIETKDNGVYTEVETNGMQNDNGMYTTGIPSDNQVVYQTETQVSVGKDKLGEDRSVQGSVAAGAGTAAAANDGKTLKRIDGSLGRSVVFLTDEQKDDLLDKLGIQGFDRYVGRLANYIIKKNAHINSHYATILKWATEDSALQDKQAKQQASVSDGTFDTDEFFEAAYRRTLLQAEERRKETK